jgi:hypothetical protein
MARSPAWRTWPNPSAEHDEQFGNARFVRNLFEAAVVRQAWRLRDVPAPTVEQLRDLRTEDLSAPPRA